MFYGRKGKGLGAPHFLPPCLLSAAAAAGFEARAKRKAVSIGGRVECSAGGRRVCGGGGNTQPATGRKAAILTP